MTDGSRIESAVELGALVRRARQAEEMTQQELADQVGTTRQWVIRLERGENSPAMSTVLVTLSVLGLEMVALHSPPL